MRRLEIVIVIWFLNAVAATRHAIHVDQKVEVVPALLSRALRVAIKESRRSAARAQKIEAHASEKKTEAKLKEEASKNRSKEIEDLLSKTREKEQRLLAKQQEVSKLMTTHNESQEVWRTQNAELEQMQQNLSEESGKYEDLKKQLQQEIANLTEKQQQAYQRLGDLQDAIEKKQEEVLKLREEAENHGTIARSASRAADDVQANLAEVQDLWSKQKVSAEEAEQEFLQAQMTAEAAERTHMDAAREVTKVVAVKHLVLAARNALQRYYEQMDTLTQSMEERLAEDTEKAAWELLREDPNMRLAALAYNNMTASFRRLYVKSKDMYMFVSASIPEIRENAEAAVLLQCDPDGSLEEEARRSGDIGSFGEKCGPGLWQALKIEPGSFPSDDETVDEDFDRELLPDQASDKAILPVKSAGAEQSPSKSYLELQLSKSFAEISDPADTD